jgi:hypothetical protein
MNVNSKQLNCVGDEAPKSKKPPIADLDSLSEEYTKSIPWWGFVRRLSGTLFWLSHGVILFLAIFVGVFSWLDIELAGWKQDILFTGGFILFWLALMIAFSGWISRSKEYR